MSPIWDRNAPPTIVTDTSGAVPEITITLNLRLGSQTTAEQLIEAIQNDPNGERAGRVQVLTGRAASLPVW
jgi:hypothetical protein